MKLAVPLFGSRVAPHFGVSSDIMLVETSEGMVVQREIVRVHTQGAMPMARFLTTRGVHALCCGGIQQAAKQWLMHNGITVIDNQKGPADEVVGRVIAAPSDLEAE
jgi:predicted Fe-Mo cluster-binding NifX family protein